MRRSVFSRIRLSLTALRRPGPLARSAATLPRPDGRLVWIIAGRGDVSGAALIARRLVARCPDLLIAMTPIKGDCADADLPPDTLGHRFPEDWPASARLVLQAWRPALILILGNHLPSALICAAARAGIPLMLADARFDLNTTNDIALLSRFNRFYLSDSDSFLYLTQRLPGTTALLTDGALQQPPDPLPCSEAARAGLAQAIGARPTWHAAAVPRAELDVILDTHRHALRQTHRILLLLTPEDERDGPALAHELMARGWQVARRSEQAEPDLTTEIFIADAPQEYGLWYRLAQVSYMGGTLSDGARAPRSPMEAAALGSAVLHGPRLGQYRDDYLRLETARAARGIASPEALIDALTDLIAPDRAAQLAHNAWMVASGGAGTAEMVVQGIAELVSRTCTGKAL